ncbi:MAG: S9 family peptidase [Rhodocyclaceae bacterium]|nr:S9 family peptidase [Rhodocyclaceae bacterium]
MSKPNAKPLTIDSLWEIERLANPALSPDGSQVVCSRTCYDQASNKTSSQLWLLSTLGGAPRQLTSCGDRDRQAAWSPRGDRVAFIAKRESAGKVDTNAQLYVIATDGGEATRVSDIAAGVEAFKWMPDGKHIVCLAWVWPQLKGLDAQNKQHRAFAERKESGYATSEGYYRYWDHNLPMDRAVHLLRVNIETGKTVDLFEGTNYELPRAELSAEMFDISPDGKRIVFMHDAKVERRASNPHALFELNVATRRVVPILDEPKWDVANPRYSPNGAQIAVIATPQTPKHTMLGQLAIISNRKRWKTLDAAWDRDVSGPLRWSAAGDTVYFLAEDQGRCHVWRRHLAKAAPELVWQGGWTQSFDLAGPRGEDVLATATDSINHPVGVYAAHLGNEEDEVIHARRLERFNDDLLAMVKLGHVEEVRVRGALGDDVQMWLVFPTNFKRDKKHAVLQVIHGGPYAASGDTFGYRWNPHLLASHGHVVAMVNYHGSSGFGHAFRDSIMGRMGELELIDIEAGTDWILAQKWADRSRVYASGGSYGGFMVAWMNGHVAPSRYRAYVCHAGVYDRAATWSADSYTQRFCDLHATYWQDLAKVAAQSPITFAANMQTPTLITHGALDYRVPDHNGLAYYNTLKARGVPARLLWFADENHWVLKAPNAKQWYGEVFAWFEAHAPKKSKKKTKTRR